MKNEENVCKVSLQLKFVTLFHQLYFLHSEIWELFFFVGLFIDWLIYGTVIPVVDQPKVSMNSVSYELRMKSTYVFTFFFFLCCCQHPKTWSG